MYLEYAALFPNRSGSLVTYLEQAYPRPVFLFPTAFAFFTVAFSFSSSNAVGTYNLLISICSTLTPPSSRAIHLPRRRLPSLRMGKQRSRHLILQFPSSALPALDKMVHQVDELDFCRETHHPSFHRHHWIRCPGRWHPSQGPASQLQKLFWSGD